MVSDEKDSSVSDAKVQKLETVKLPEVQYFPQDRSPGLDNFSELALIASSEIVFQT